MSALKEINLSDAPLKNIMLMAPRLDEVSQNRVLGVVFGLMAGKEGEKTKELQSKKRGRLKFDGGKGEEENR